MDAYDPCPCGSGKKFKWCCQPIHAQIDKAFRQDAEGQHEAALRAMEQVTNEHAGNPEAWGRKAELLYNAGKIEEAESALQKALDINPNYPFGHLLRGSFRRAEGEITGALMLFRKAADLYDPQAKGILAQLHTLIFDCEMKLNHPVAGRAAAQMALRFNPAAQDLRQGIDSVFSDKNPNLPRSAWQEYKYQASAAEGPRRATWDSALASAATGKLSDAARAFEQLVQEDPADKAALYNLGLTQAWLGNNAAAVETLEKYVAAESDEGRAGEAWALAEVLLCGQGMEDRAQFVEHSLTVPLKDPQAFLDQGLVKLDQEGLLAGVQVNKEEGVLTGVVLEKPPPALTPELQAKQSPRLGAFIALMGNVLRLWNVNKEALDRGHELLRERAGRVMADPYVARGPVKFFDVLAECLIFPPPTISETELEPRLREHLEKYFEENWLHRPLKSLGQAPPIDAAGHPTLRKKLRGIVQFIQECVALSHFPYDFERLRRKLNLVEITADSPGAPAEAPGTSLDIGAMGAAELAGLQVESLNDAQLEEAFQTARKLDAPELAGKFAQAAVARPSRADKPDRYPFFNHLVQTALAQGDTTAALDHLNLGEKDDCAHNQGQRRNDYERRRGQVHAKAGQFTEAQDVFDRLIARVPGELPIRFAAAEAMLSAREGAHALAYAEQGLAEARKQNKRDAEEQFLELQAAAKRQSGG